LDAPFFVVNVRVIRVTLTIRGRDIHTGTNSAGLKACKLLAEALGVKQKANKKDGIRYNYTERLVYQYGGILPYLNPIPVRNVLTSAKFANKH
jgi:hypothetical protein